jgi:hypothetical protein
MNGMLIEICKGTKSLKFYAFNFTSNVIPLSQENLQNLFPFYSGNIIVIEFIFTLEILERYEEFSVIL